MTQPQDDLPVALSAYFIQRQATRRTAVTQTLDGLTERERLLVKEAAVMGWVQGMRYHNLQYPGDRQVLNTVIDACITFSDLYPTITNHTTEQEL